MDNKPSIEKARIKRADYNEKLAAEGLSFRLFSNKLTDGATPDCVDGLRYSGNLFEQTAEECQ